MSVERATLDTNILVYAVDIDAGERHEQAIRIVDEAAVGQNCVLTLQALGEFFAVVARKSKMPLGDARMLIQQWQTLFPVIVAKPVTLVLATRGVIAYQLSFWDAMIWATAKQNGVEILLTEDFQHGQIIEGIEIRNPFVGE